MGFQVTGPDADLGGSRMAGEKDQYREKNQDPFHILLSLNQIEAFLEDEGDGRDTLGGDVMEGVFLSGFQPGHEGGHRFNLAQAIGVAAVRRGFCFDGVMDDISLDGNGAGESVILEGTVYQRIRAGDAQVSVFVFQGKDRFDSPILSRPGVCAGGAPGIGKVLGA